MTADEFLLRMERQPDGARHELVDGRPVEMQAERNRHALVRAETWLLRDAVRAMGLPGTSIALADCFAPLDRLARPD